VQKRLTAWPYFFALLESAHSKAARRTLMKLNPDGTLRGFVFELVLAFNWPQLVIESKFFHSVQKKVVKIFISVLSNTRFDDLEMFQFFFWKIVKYEAMSFLTYIGMTLFTTDVYYLKWKLWRDKILFRHSWVKISFETFYEDFQFFRRVAGKKRVWTHVLLSRLKSR